MNRFKIVLCLVVLAWCALAIFGTQPERRYANGMGCVYRMIYKTDRPVGLVVTGGSSMQTAVFVGDMDAMLTARGIDHDPVHSTARSNYTFAGEHMLMREFISQRPVKTALIMIDPATDTYEMPDWPLQLARISDIPEVVSNLDDQGWQGKVDVVRSIVVNHLRPTNGGMPLNFFSRPQSSCQVPDARMDMAAMEEAENVGRTVRGTALDWDLSAPEQRPLLESVRRMKEFTDSHGVQLFYIVMSRTNQALPSSQLVQTFERATGASLLVFTPELHEWLARNGRRDATHINQAGRDVFMPWLLEEILDRCERPDGCF